MAMALVHIWQTLLRESLETELRTLLYTFMRTMRMVGRVLAHSCSNSLYGPKQETEASVQALSRRLRAFSVRVPVGAWIR